MSWLNKIIIQCNKNPSDSVFNMYATLKKTKRDIIFNHPIDFDKKQVFS